MWNVVIERRGIQETFDQFLARYGLTVTVGERSARSDLPRFFASIRSLEVKDGTCLKSTFGQGATPEDALMDYQRCLLGERLVLNAYGTDRVEIEAPNAWLP